MTCRSPIIAASPASMMRSNRPPDSATSLPFFNRIDPDRTFGATVGTLRANEYAADWDAYFSLQENISSHVQAYRPLPR
jgi:hypothetical protein